LNIGIDIRSTLKRKTGIGYYTLNLINNLAKIDKQNKYFLYSKISLSCKDKKLPSLRTGKNFKHLVNRFRLKSQFLLRNMDVFYTSSFDLPKPRKSKQVLVIYDVIHKSYPSGYWSEKIKDIDNSFKSGLSLADVIIAPSLITKNDILRYYEVDEDKIHLIYPGINGHLQPCEELSIKQKEDFLNKYNLSVGSFILFVGTLSPRKNVDGLIHAYKILKDKINLKYKLVIIGMKGWSYDTIFDLVEKYGLGKDIIFPGYLEEDELIKFYKTADIFVYTSFYEGAGLPVLEALSFGLPVVTSKSSSMSEIAQDAAILVDPYKPEEIAEGILRLINDVKLKQDLKAKALRRTKELSWESAARKTLEIFDSCMK